MVGSEVTFMKSQWRFLAEEGEAERLRVVMEFVVEAWRARRPLMPGKSFRITYQALGRGAKLQS